MKKLLVLVLSLCFVSFAMAVDVDKAALTEAMNAHAAGVELTKAQDALLGGNGAVIDNFGGPDAMGYSWKDSEEVDGPTYGWIDITGTGTSIIANTADDNTSGPYPIGFGFTFYGTTYTDWYLGSNGAINFDGQYISLSNYAMPYASYQAMIAWFWDDMDPADATDADCLYETMMVGGQNALVISFLNWDEYPGNVDPTLQESVTAQMILFEDGTVQIHYFDVETGIDISSCTIGIQDASGTIGLTALYNGSILAYPYAQLAIEFSQAAADASVSGYVYDATTDNPIVGATVQVGGMVTQTDGLGYYEFLDVFSGLYAWTASAFGYAAGMGDINVVPGANTLDIWLDPINMDADVLIVDVDATIDSGPQIDAILQGLGYTTLYCNDFFEYPWENYEYVFLFTGIYPNYFAIGTGSAEEQVCIDYLNANGNLYTEGGDLYGYIPPANLLAMLPLTGISDGSGDLANVLGDGPLTGLDLAYIGENSYIDHIEPVVGAVRLGYNPVDQAGCLVVDNQQLYHTACASFELGMLVDGVARWTRADIVAEIMNNFNSGVEPSPVNLYLTPTNTMIPPEGGNVVYDAQLVSDIPMAMNGLRYQTFVTLPNAQVMGPIDNIPFNLTPFMNVTVTGMTLGVPDYAPMGSYMLEGIAGVPNNPALQVSDSFPFAKVGPGLVEDFDVDPGPTWSWSTVNGTNIVEGGYAKLNMVAASDTWGSGVYTGDTYGDCSVSSTFEFIVTQGYSVGVMVRGTGVNDLLYSGYAVYCSNGSWSAWRYDTGATWSLVGWTADPAILMGVGAINTLQVDAIGGNFDVTFNGTYVGSFMDATYASGFSGFACAYTNETWFDNMISTHMGVPPVAGPIDIGQLEPVLRDDMGIVITDEADLYTPGVAFDRSAEFGEPIEFIAEDWVGNGSFIAGEEASVVGLPTSFSMAKAYPNPFNPSTSVAIALPQASELTVTVFNVMGQQVSTLANGKFNAGQHNFSFDASNLASGLYFIQAQVPGELNAIQKVTLMK